MNISVKSYKEAIRTLSPKHQEFLKALFYSPDSTATGRELAASLGYNSYQAANRHIGEIGKRIGTFLDVEFETYFDYRSGEREAYFYTIGPWTDKGWKMWPALRKALVSLKLVAENGKQNQINERLTTEVLPFVEEKALKEGKATLVPVNKYERNYLARRMCIEIHGRKCKACDFDFERFYGKSAEGFIHVHHVRPLHTIKKSYVVDPENDLVPLCPNCHSVVHLQEPALSIEELKKMLQKQKRLSNRTTGR
ncbi:MAG: hypothetical protein EOO08_12130 [Chitinophagaceae bacterium]|nr:MAG: hypothetical protein EOO08_12130 [Chitinophagaceae bacterium]